MEWKSQKASNRRKLLGLSESDQTISHRRGAREREFGDGPSRVNRGFKPDQLQ